MEDKDCSTCKYFVPPKRYPDAKLGECRWGPPQHYINENENGFKFHEVIFPLVNDKMWCGQYKQRDE